MSYFSALGHAPYMLRIYLYVKNKVSIFFLEFIFPVDIVNLGNGFPVCLFAEEVQCVKNGSWFKAEILIPYNGREFDCLQIQDPIYFRLCVLVWSHRLCVWVWSHIATGTVHF